MDPVSWKYTQSLLNLLEDMNKEIKNLYYLLFFQWMDSPKNHSIMSINNVMHSLSITRRAHIDNKKTFNYPSNILY